MLSMLFASALTSVLLALFVSSLGRAKSSHVVVVGVLAALSVLWLIASIVAVSQ